MKAVFENCYSKRSKLICYDLLSDVGLYIGILVYFFKNKKYVLYKFIKLYLHDFRVAIKA